MGAGILARLCRPRHRADAGRDPPCRFTVTGVSVNPARPLGPAVFVGGTAVAQLWVFIAAPLAGGALAGILHAAGVTRAD